MIDVKTPLNRRLTMAEMAESLTSSTFSLVDHSFPSLDSRDGKERLLKWCVSLWSWFAFVLLAMTRCSLRLKQGSVRAAEGATFQIYRQIHTSDRG
jgi:hypothetical protein